MDLKTAGSKFTSCRRTQRHSMPDNIMFMNDVAQSDNKTITGIAHIGISPLDLAERCVMHVALQNSGGSRKPCI